MSRICGAKTTTGKPCTQVVEDHHDHCEAGHLCPPVKTALSPKNEGLDASAAVSMGTEDLAAPPNRTEAAANTHARGDTEQRFSIRDIAKELGATLEEARLKVLELITIDGADAVFDTRSVDSFGRETWGADDLLSPHSAKDLQNALRAAADDEVFSASIELRRAEARQLAAIRAAAARGRPVQKIAVAASSSDEAISQILQQGGGTDGA